MNWSKVFLCIQTKYSRLKLPEGCSRILEFVNIREILRTWLV